MQSRAAARSLSIVSAARSSKVITTLAGGFCATALGLMGAALAVSAPSDTRIPNCECNAGRDALVSTYGYVCSSMNLFADTFDLRPSGNDVR
jgi:hypothetical protein